LKPFLPEGVPWQAPELQPPTLIAAIILVRKLIGLGFSVSLTMTGSLIDCVPATMVIVPAPFLACDDEAGLIDGDDGLIDGVGGQRRQVADRAVGILAGDDELLYRPRTGQGQVSRLNDESGGSADDGGPFVRLRRHDGTRGGRQQEQS